ncbi:phosphotransferase [Pseudonocardia sp. CA-107938]|uniref:phosphotransferase n=1 Tax=Pseudonocardia sp. CA-107938 TaxID=3240021 RepID=UPI003D8FEC73
MSITAEEDAAVRRVFEPGSEWSGPDAVVEVLSGGAAHKNYLVRLAGRKRVVKIWNGYWEAVNVLPPADVILSNTLCASRIGVGAPVAAVCRESSGIALEFLEGTQPSLAGDVDALEHLVSALHALHASGERFARDLNPFVHVRTLLATARQRGYVIPIGLPVIEAQLEEIEEVLDLRPAEFVPCHNDLWDANVIGDGAGYRLIDWDLAANTDPAYELGFLAAYNGFDRARTRQLASLYYGADDPRHLARIRLFMIVAHWSNSALWTVAQGNARPNDDFDYAAELVRSWHGLLAELLAPDHRANLALARRTTA